MFVLLLSLLFVCVLPKSLPPDIKKCRLMDPQLEACLKKNIVEASQKLKKGTKELGIVSLEPLVIPKLEFGNSTSASIQIRQEYTNLKFIGMTNFKALDLDVKFTDKDCHLHLKLLAKKVIMNGDYKMSGQLLMFPINGHGKCNNTLYNCLGTFNVECERYVKRKENYIRVTKLFFKMQPKKIVYDYTNIFDGNEQLSKAIVTTLNENALVVYEDMGQAFTEALGQVFKQITNNLFSRVPENELFIL